MNRKDEIHKLLTLTPEEVIEQAGEHLIVCDSVEDFYQLFAQDIATEIQSHNEKKTSTRLILPVGPTGQYPILAEIINKNKISLKSSTFFFMDEYADDGGVDNDLLPGGLNHQPFE